MAKRRSKGDGGLFQRHDHPTCPPLEVVGYRDDGRPIKERPDHTCKGRWSGTIEIVDSNGRQRKTVYGRTKAEAKAKLGKAARDKDAGTLVIRSTTVEKWFTYWLDNIAAPDCKPQTMRGYRSKVNRYIIPRLGRVRLTELRPDHIRTLLDWMREDQELSDRSARHVHAILRNALGAARREGQMSHDPVDAVKAPKNTKQGRPALTVEQGWRVLRAAGDDPRWWLALYYGMRQGEVLGLRWQDVDLERKVLHITQTLQLDENYAVTFGAPKSEASQRTIPLVPLIEARLRLHWINSGQPSEGLLFTDAGQPIRPAKDWQRWRDLIARATVPPWAPLPTVALHSARNTAADIMEESGIQDRLVAQIYGHTHVHITHGYQNAEVARVREALLSMSGPLELA